MEAIFMNEIYILMDDSGVLSKKEKTFVYGGLFFYSKDEYNDFINKYRKLINKIKCKYCHHHCDNNCPEIKACYHLSSSNRNEIFNLLKKEKSYGVFINNEKVLKRILDNKLAKGRFCEYVQKRIIKEIVNYSIKNNIIDINLPLYMDIKIDESTIKSDGYYNLYNSIYKELVYGMKSYTYPIMHKALLKDKLILKVKKYNSKKHFGIQSADMIANLIHKKFKINNIKELDFLTIKLFLP